MRIDYDDSLEDVVIKVNKFIKEYNLKFEFADNLPHDGFELYILKEIKG